MKIRMTENELEKYVHKAILEEINWSLPYYTEPLPKGYGVLKPEEYSNSNYQENSKSNYGERAPFESDNIRVAKFQTWFNLNMCGPNKNTPITVDGFWGKETQGAWDMWLKNNRK